jgi:O-antigen/teichoic acid export membrane protein
MLKKIHKYSNSGVLPFLVIKYISLGIQFISTLLIVKELGVFYFGIWSFILLVKQYLGYSNLGVNYSLNAIIATNDHLSTDSRKETFQNAVTITVIVFFALLGAWVIYFYLDSDVFYKYNFKQFSGWLIIYFLFENINQLYINLYRLFSDIKKIAIFQFLMAIARLFPIFIFEGESLIYGLLISQLIFSLISFLMFSKNSPVPFGFAYNFEVSNNVLKRGLNLLFYNLSFYFLLMSTRTLVGYFYSVDIFGELGFAIQLAAISHVGLNTISFLFFPKFLNRLKRNEDRSKTINNLDIIKEKYTFAYMLFTLSMFCLCPLITVLFPDYKMVVGMFALIMLMNVSLSLGYSHSSLMISWGYESINTKIGIVSVIVNVLLFLGLQILFQNILISLSASVISGFLYSVLIIINAEKILGEKRKVFSWREVVSFLVPCVLAIIVFNNELIMGVFSSLPLIIFILFNRIKLIVLFKTGLNLLTNSNALKL